MNLSDKAKKQIQAKLPDIDERFLVATQSGLGVAQYDVHYNSQLHVALVCLQDAFRRLEIAHTALWRSYECYVWHMDESDDDEKSRKFWADFNGKFYADYTTLLLYATGEDIASFILHFLSVENEFAAWTKDNLESLEKRRISSQQAQVGVFMCEQYPDHEITKVIVTLKENAEWKCAINYRNTWVHDKPPILGVFGNEFDRSNRVKIGEGYRSFPLGTGAEANITAAELMEIALGATVVCANSLSALLEILIVKRSKLGEDINFESGAITTTIF